MTSDIISKENSKEKEMLQRLNLLKQSLANKAEVSIIGHDNIDVDAFLSGVLLSRLLKFLNVNANFIILQPIKKNDTYEIISDLTDINMYSYEENSEDESRNLFLVDHYETTHKGKIVGCIDHHPTEKENTYVFSYVRNSSASAYLVYELMKVANYPITAEEAKLIIISMMVDTTAFRSSKTILEEVEAAKLLAKEFNLDYKYLEKYCLCLTPIEKMNVDQITSNGQKQYDYNGHKVQSAYLQLYGIPDEVTMNKWLDYLNNKVADETTNIEMIVFIIFDTKSNITYEYQVMQYCIKKIIHNGILSRGKDIMPKIERRYCNKNNQEKLEAIVKTFSDSKHTIATMESCTGGSLASAITDISGASDVLHESYIAYCNEAKIKFGVPEEVIKKYTVYSQETSRAMANAVKITANSDVGIGITGQLGRINPQNTGVAINKAWYSIKSLEKELCVEIILKIEDYSRKKKKEVIVKEIIEDLYLW